MLVEKKSSGVAKAGLATGTVGAALGALNALGGGLNVLNGLAGNCGRTYQSVCNEDHLVDRYTMDLKFQIAEKDTQIALRDANTFADQKSIELYKYFEGRMREMEQLLCKQEVKNQQTADSFQIISERLDCCCKEMDAKICNERNERKCADNSIVNYANATFYPKQVADVTTGTATTAQTLYNPLPVNNSGNGCCC